MSDTLSIVVMNADRLHYVMNYVFVYSQENHVIEREKLFIFYYVSLFFIQNMWVLFYQYYFINIRLILR